MNAVAGSGLRFRPKPSPRASMVTDRLSLATGFGVALLVFVTPLGGESTAGWTMFLHRALLFVIVGLCVVGLRNRETHDLGLTAYTVLGATLLIMFMAIWVSNRSPFDGFYLWYQHLLFAALFVMLARFARGQSLRWRYAVLGGIILAIFAHMTWGFLTDSSPLIGTFINPNYFGSYLVVGFAACMAVATRHTTALWRLAASFAGAAFLLGITQTLSRGALIAAVGVSALALYRMSTRVKIAAAVVGLVILAGFSSQLISKFSDVGSLDPYNYMRPKIWSSTLSMIAEHPLMGVGLAGYEDVASQFPVAAEGTIGRYARRHRMAHSEYLHYPAEIGIPGTLIFFGLLAYFLVGMARERARLADGEAVLTEAGFLVAAGVSAHAVVDNNFSVPVVSALVAVVALARIPLPRYSTLAMPGSAAARTAFAAILAMLFLHSAVVPALATHFNEAGQKAFLAGQFDAAERAHRRSVAVAPTHPLLLTNLGAMYLDRFSKTRDAHWLDVADAFLARAVAVNPDFIVARRQRHVILTLKLQSSDASTLNLFSQLIRNSQEILRVDPVSVFVRRNMAEALHATGNRDGAIEELLRTIELEPNFVPAYQRLAQWYEEAGELARSESFATAADEILNRFVGADNMNGYEAELLGLNRAGLDSAQVTP